MRPTEEDLNEAEPREEETGSEGSSCDSSDTVILLPQTKKRRSFEIPTLSEDEDEEEITKRRRIEAI